MTKIEDEGIEFYLRQLRFDVWNVHETLFRSKQREKQDAAVVMLVVHDLLRKISDDLSKVKAET